MTTGFVQAYARLVSQDAEDSDDTDSLSSWDANHPVVPSDDDDNFPLTSDEEDGNTGKKKPKSSYRSLDWKYWHHGNQEYLYSQTEVEEALWVLAGEEFGGKKANGLFFVKGPWRETKTKEVRTWRCAFYNCCQCKAGYQVVYWKIENRWSIQVASNTPHTHGLSSNGRMKQALASCVDSPGKFQKPPKLLIGDATMKLNQKFTQVEQTSLRRMIGRRRVAHTISGLTNGGDGSYYGDVVDSLLRKYKRENIDAFTRDSVYLLGDDVCVDAIVDGEGNESVRFYCVLSTENLLLNGPRQMSTGQRLMLAVDGSYRYVTEKDHGLFIVKTLNHSQSAKTLAYAICNKEDKEALVWIFHAIKKETERIVNTLIQEDVIYM